MGLLPGTQRREQRVLKWERLGAYSDVRIQIITMSKKEKKNTFLTQHGTNEERQNWEEENVLSNRCVLDAMWRHFVPHINSTNDIGRLPECCVREFPFRSFVIVSSDNAPSVLRKENRGRHRR